MPRYFVTFEAHDHERYIDEVIANSPEEAIMIVESENDSCYSALFAEDIFHKNGGK